MSDPKNIIRTSRYIILLGCSCFFIYAGFLLGSYYYSIDRLNREFEDSIFPELAERVDARIELFFKPSIAGLSLLSETLDWPAIMQKAASDPRWLKSNMKSWAEELDISSVGVSDRYRRIVWDYWSDKPIILDSSLSRDKWFFDFWGRSNIPDWTFTLYSEKPAKDYQLYMDRVIHDKSGHPIGSIAGQVSLSRLREQLLTIASEGERIMILDDHKRAVIDVSRMEASKSARLSGIDNSNVEDNINSREDLLIKKILSQTYNYGYFTLEDRDIYFKRTSLFNGAMPILTVMDTSYYLKKKSDILIKDLVVLFITFIFFIGGVLITMMLFTQRLKSLAIKLERDKSKFEDLLFIITHNFSNEILLLQKSLASLPDRISNSLYLRLYEMSLMIQNSVNAARLDSNKSLTISNIYDFSWQWEKLVSNFKVLSEAKGQSFCSSPPVCCKINNDEEMVYQILANLVSNAIKYSPIDGLIKMNAVLELNTLLITISDSGPGFSTEDRKNLFSKFKKMSARPTGGERSTGLGLYIVKQIADACNIKLELLESTNGDCGAVWALEIKTVQSAI